MSKQGTLLGIFLLMTLGLCYVEGVFFWSEKPKQKRESRDYWDREKDSFFTSKKVVNLTSANFDKLVTNGAEADHWIVLFYVPSSVDCKDFAFDYSLLADIFSKENDSKFRGVIRFGAINTEEEHRLEDRYNIRTYPAIKIFTRGEIKDFNGELKMSEFFIRDINRLVEVEVKPDDGDDEDGTKDMFELTDDNFDQLVLQSNEPWLVELFSPNCFYCKKLAPYFAKAAQKLKGKMKVGALDATVNTLKASEYGFQGFPRIKFFPAGNKIGSDEYIYNGNPNTNSILYWAHEKLATIPIPGIPQIVNDETLTETCRKHSICIIFVLPHILDCDSKCRIGYLEMLRELGEEFKVQGWGWTWVQAADYLKLEESIEMGALGYPTMAAVNVKKGEFIRFCGSFSKVHVAEFLKDL